MAFEKLHFCSYTNQQVSGERIEAWQYESIDPQSAVISANYFAEIRQPLKVNDAVKVIEMDPARTVAQRRYDLTVRVNGGKNRTNMPAIVVLPELADATTTLLEFPNISATATIALPVFPAAVEVVGAYAVLLGILDGSSSLKVEINSTDPKTIYSGTLTAPTTYWMSLVLAPGTADTDTAYVVKITPTSVPASAGKLSVFV
jgi:hypothetical protein